MTNPTMEKFSRSLVLAIAGLLVVQLTHAMCVATTKNLVRLEVYACQRIKIDASSSRPPAHTIHRPGSSVIGTLITGRVIESALVWDGDSSNAAYLYETEKVATDESSTFFLRADASKICPKLLRKEATFVTDRPCCDVLPADGLCLVPATMTIVKEEKNPERWTKWTKDKPPHPNN